MSRTLTLIQNGWETARAIATLAIQTGGRKSDALARLEMLLARPDVPADILAPARRLAGELALALGRYAVARRHLRASAPPESAEATNLVAAQVCFLLGRAWEEDPDGCDRRAAVAFRRAVRLDGDNALYLARFGLAAARCG
ncbi:MAG: hypothetical protein K2V38_12700 [Gemmataceae bacterium]|nr:hypothetical protein [Gemmataceae bacterium]